MSGKETGLFRKYEVKKLSNPEKDLDCIVLEFDDPIARKGIEAWANAMRDAGYEKCYADALSKLSQYEAAV